MRVKYRVRIENVRGIDHPIYGLKGRSQTQIFETVGWFKTLPDFYQAKFRLQHKTGWFSRWKNVADI